MQTQSLYAAVRPEKQSNDAAAHLPVSICRGAKVEVDAKVVTEKLAVIERQKVRSGETGENALTRLTKSSKRVEQLEEVAQGSKSRLSKMTKAHDAAPAESNIRRK